MRPMNDSLRLVYEALHDLAFPNGKIWFSYPWEADKRRAYIVHANWNKQMKKSRLMRDNLWFLTPDDTQCRSDIDPMRNGCSKMCYPIQYAAPGGAPRNKTCSTLNKEDDSHVRRYYAHWAKSNFTTTAPNLGGLLWDPMAYASLPDCQRILNRTRPAAQIFHDKLTRVYWHEWRESPTIHR